jgi:hypothetical protein
MHMMIMMMMMMWIGTYYLCIDVLTGSPSPLVPISEWILK